MPITTAKSQIANQKSIDTLNNLLEINNDRIDSYERAYKETNETDLKDLFSQLKETAYHCRQELITEVKKLGGIPKDDSRTTGKLVRIWMDIKAALTKKDRMSILRSCESGEDVAVNSYEEVLKKCSGDDSTCQLLSRQYSMIKADHDRVKSLRDAAAVMNN